MPLLLRRFEADRIYNLSMAAWPLAFLMFPLLNMIARFGLDQDTGKLGAGPTALMWLGIAIVLVLSRAGGVAS